VLVATALATLPSTTSVADAGPVAVSSAGGEPGIFGNPRGSASQMRPHSVSVWLVTTEPLGPAAALGFAPGTRPAVVDVVGETVAPEVLHADTHRVNTMSGARCRR